MGDERPNLTERWLGKAGHHGDTLEGNAQTVELGVPESETAKALIAKPGKKQRIDGLEQAKAYCACENGDLSDVSQRFI